MSLLSPLLGEHLPTPVAPSCISFDSSLTPALVTFAAPSGCLWLPKGLQHLPSLMIDLTPPPQVLRNYALCSEMHHSWRRQSSSSPHQSNSAPDCCTAAPCTLSPILPCAQDVPCPALLSSPPVLIPKAKKSPPLTEQQQEEGRTRRTQPATCHLPQHFFGLLAGAPSP